ncbi:3-isopropylmalate dehydratase small subunit [Brevundimonas vesicularis]|uniref:3-isopropylmalate dehydratase small subunit n=1 Tax=Brevundimonas vesicularis TaxID=41276 RepID=UPI0038D4A27B
MQPFNRLTGVAASLPLANVDTDKILAGQFLKTTARSGLGVHLFHFLRYDDAGEERADFVLNREPWTQASILVAGPNFGCGSSREHAPWALLDFGIRCIVAPSFADIFYNNCFKNGILPVVLKDAEIERMHADADQSDTARMTVDLPSQTLVLANGDVFAFTVDADRKQALLEGRDELSQSLAAMDAIRAWEARTGDLWGRDILPRDVAEPVQ